ncbi:hypothetical protein KSS87_018330, partial [Heliosperma pusillum]
MKDEESVIQITPSTSTKKDTSTTTDHHHTTTTTIFGKGRYKIWALAAILLLAFWSMFTGTVTLRWSTGNLTRLSNDLDFPLPDDLDVLEMEEREKVVKYMWDVYTNSRRMRLPKFWQQAFEAAYEDMANDIGGTRDFSVSEIAKMSVRSIDLDPPAVQLTTLGGSLPGISAQSGDNLTLQSWVCNWLSVLLKVNNKQEACLSFLCTIWTIWVVRCRKVFDNTECSPIGAILLYQESFNLALSAEDKKSGSIDFQTRLEEDMSNLRNGVSYPLIQGSLSCSRPDIYVDAAWSKVLAAGWEKQPHWHVIAKIHNYDSTPPRSKIYNSSASDDLVRKRRSFNKLGHHHRRIRRNSYTSISSDSGRESPARLSEFMRKMVPPCRAEDEVVEGKVRESYAVVKRSENPYNDFRRSMAEMVVEKNMFDRKDMEELLRCFLSLNSESLHGVIVEAFVDIWDALFCPGPDVAVTEPGIIVKND